MFENLVRRNNYPTVDVSSKKENLDVSMEFLGSLFKSKEQRQKEKLEKARASFVDEMEKAKKRVVNHSKPRAEKIFKEIQDHFKIIESEVKTKKFNQEKFKTLVFLEEWIVRYKDGLMCINHVSEFNNEIKTLLELPINITETEASKQDTTHDELYKRIHKSVDIFFDALYDNENMNHVTFAAAGYDASFVSTLLKNKNLIIDGFTEELKIYDEMIRFFRSCIEQSSKIDSVYVLRILKDRWGTINYYTDYHPNEVIEYLLIYALCIIKNCYE